MVLLLDSKEHLLNPAFQIWRGVIHTHHRHLRRLAVFDTSSSSDGKRKPAHAKDNLMPEIINTPHSVQRPISD